MSDYAQAIEIEKRFSVSPQEAACFIAAINAISKSFAYSTTAEAIQKEAMRAAVRSNCVSFLKIADIKLCKKIADAYSVLLTQPTI
jgi:hypothetical protein